MAVPVMMDSIYDRMLNWSRLFAFPFYHIANGRELEMKMKFQF